LKIRRRSSIPDYQGVDILKEGDDLNRFGMFSWFGYPMPFEDRLELIKGAGFSATGFWLGPEEELAGKGKADLLPDIIRSRGLFLDYVHAPDIGCNDVWSESEARRGEWRRVYRSYVDLCERHSIPFLVMHVSQSKGEQSESPTEEGLSAMMDFVKAAEDSSVKIAVENTMQPALLDLIFSHIQSDYLGFCYDTSHDFLYSTKPGALLKRWGHRLLVTHLGDNDGVHDCHWLPGLGILNWEEIMRWFPTKTYQGSLTLEVFPKDQENEPAPDFIASAYQSIERLYNLLQGEA
jgi:sugar phosphate isomerase/epimerase